MLSHHHRHDLINIHHLPIDLCTFNICIIRLIMIYSIDSVLFSILIRIYYGSHRIALFLHCIYIYVRIYLPLYGVSIRYRISSYSYVPFWRNVSGNEMGRLYMMTSR